MKFQQNLNHWFNGLPGVLDVSVSYDVNRVGEEDFEVLSSLLDFPAHEQLTQTNFSVQISNCVCLVCLIFLALCFMFFLLDLKKASSHAVLRFRYVSNNPDEQYPSNK